MRKPLLVIRSAIRNLPNAYEDMTLNCSGFWLQCIVINCNNNNTGDPQGVNRAKLLTVWPRLHLPSAPTADTASPHVWEEGSPPYCWCSTDCRRNSGVPPVGNVGKLGVVFWRKCRNIRDDRCWRCYTLYATTKVLGEHHHCPSLRTKGSKGRPKSKLMSECQRPPTVTLLYPLHNY